MELDIAIQIKNATLEDLQRLFGQQDISGIYPAQAVIVPVEDRREENLGRSTVQCDGCHPKPCSGCKYERERCQHRPYVKGDHICRFFIQTEENTREENLARSTIPSDELKSKKEVGNRYHQKWDIPFNSTTESAKYEMARKLCKRFNKPYPEALKLAGAGDTKKERKSAPTRWLIPFSSRTQPHEYYLAWTLCRKYTLPYPEALKRQEEEKTGVILQKAAGNVAECSPVPSDLIITGIDVQQIKPDKGKQFFGTARVLERKGDLVTVKNGIGKRHTIDVKFLEIATSPKKPKVEEKSPISTLQEPESDTKGELKSATRQHLPAKSKKTPGKTMKCPYCDHVSETRGMHKHAKSRHPDQYDISGVTAYIAGKNIISPLKEVVDPFPLPPETRAAALPSQEQEPVMEAVVPDEDPLEFHIEGIEGLDDDTQDASAPEEDPSIWNDPEEQSSPAEEPVAGDTDDPLAKVPSQAPEQPGGLRRGQLVRYNGAKSDLYYGQTGTIERCPPQLSECLVRFKMSTSWVKKDDLVPVETAQR